MTLVWHDDVNECCRLNEPELRRIARGKTSATDDRQFEADVTVRLQAIMATLHDREKLHQKLDNEGFWESRASDCLNDLRWRVNLVWHDDVGECCTLNAPKLQSLAHGKTRARDDRQFEDDVTQCLLDKMRDLHDSGELEELLHNKGYWESRASFFLKDLRKKDKRWQAECPECGRVLQYSRKEDRTCRSCKADVPKARFSSVHNVSLSQSNSGTALQFPSGTVAPPHCALIDELREKMVQSLDPVSRQIVRLKFWHSFSDRKICEWTGMEKRQVQQRLQQALQRLNNLLDDPQSGANEV